MGRGKGVPFTKRIASEKRRKIWIDTSWRRKRIFPRKTSLGEVGPMESRLLSWEPLSLRPEEEEVFVKKGGRRIPY